MARARRGAGPGDRHDQGAAIRIVAATDFPIRRRPASCCNTSSTTTSDRRIARPACQRWRDESAASCAAPSAAAESRLSTGGRESRCSGRDRTRSRRSSGRAPRPARSPTGARRRGRRPSPILITVAAASRAAARLESSPADISHDNSPVRLRIKPRATHVSAQRSVPAGGLKKARHRTRVAASGIASPQVASLKRVMLRVGAPPTMPETCSCGESWSDQRPGPSRSRADAAGGRSHERGRFVGWERVVDRRDLAVFDLGGLCRDRPVPAAAARCLVCRSGGPAHRGRGGRCLAREVRRTDAPPVPGGSQDLFFLAFYIVLGSAGHCVEALRARQSRSPRRRRSLPPAG